MLKSRKREDVRVSQYPRFFAGIILFLSLLCVTVFAQESFIYDSQEKRDPFIPIITPDGRYQKLEPEETQKDTTLNLEGIIYDKYGISYAIVDGLVVKVGDTVDDYQVLKIEESKVIFIKEGQLTEIELKKEGT